MRTSLAVAALLLTAGTATVYAQGLPGTPRGVVLSEEAVAGHTVHKTISFDKSQRLAAIAALISEVGVPDTASGAGDDGLAGSSLLWFDDSFLHRPERIPVCGGGFWILQRNQPTTFIDFAVTTEDNPQETTVPVGNPTRNRNVTISGAGIPTDNVTVTGVSTPRKVFIPRDPQTPGTFIQPLEDLLIRTDGTLHGTSITWRVVEYNADPSNENDNTRFWGVEVLTPSEDTSSQDGCVVEDGVPGNAELDFGYNALAMLPFDKILGPSGTVQHDPANDPATEEGTKEGNSHPYNPDGCTDPSYHCHSDDPAHEHDTKQVDLEYRAQDTPQPSRNVVFCNHLANDPECP